MSAQPTPGIGAGPGSGASRLKKEKEKSRKSRDKGEEEKEKVKKENVLLTEDEISETIDQIVEVFCDPMIMRGGEVRNAVRHGITFEGMFLVGRWKQAILT
jgi:hypothetical protein